MAQSLARRSSPPDARSSAGGVRIPLVHAGLPARVQYWAEVSRDPATKEQVAVVYRSGPVAGGKCEFFTCRFAPRTSEATLRRELGKRLAGLQSAKPPAYPGLQLQSIHQLLFLLRQFCQSVRSPGLGFAAQHVTISFEDQHCLICDGKGEPLRATHSESLPDGCVDECTCKDGYEVLDPNRAVALHFYPCGGATPRMSYSLADFLEVCRRLEPIPLS